MLGYTWGGSGAFFPQARMRKRSVEDRAYDYPRYLAAMGGLDWQDFVTPNRGATPILKTAETSVYEQVMDRLRRDGVQDFVATGMGASPVLERAQQYLDAERAAAMGGGSLPTGMGATPILGRARQALYGEFWNTPGGNAPKIESALTSEVEPPLVTRSGGATLPDPWQDSATAPRQVAPAGGAGGPARYLGADMVYDQGTGQGATTIRPPAAPGRYLGADMVYDQGTGQGATPISSRNMSDGGPGTSTAKGQAAIDRGMSRRGMVEAFDNFLAFPAQGAGEAARQGLRDAAAAAYRKGFTNVGGLLKGASGMARWAVPAGAFAATTGLPAVMGALEGAETAGLGGAALQGGSALAGGLIGQAVIPVPFVGAAVGSMVGNMVGGGLSRGAVAAVEKAQAGDTGVMGGIGRALDSFVDTPFEKEQKAILQQMNSPAMQAIKLQEETRRMREQSARNQQLFSQAALQGLLG